MTRPRGRPDGHAATLDQHDAHRRCSRISSRCCRASSKPVQYVGGELNAQREGLGVGRGPVGADVPRRVRGRAAQPGHHDPLRGAQRAGRRARRALLRGLAGPRGADARARRARVHRRRRTGRWARSTCSGSASPPSSATPTCSPRSTSPASRCTPSTAPTTTRSWSPAGTRRSTRSRSPTSSTSRRSATARRSSARSPTSCRAWKADGRPGGRRELLLRLAAIDGCYVPSLYDVSYGADGAIAAVTPVDERVPRTVTKRTTTDLDAWPYPKAAAGAAGRDRARAGQRGDLPRLHPRLPVLPGRDDHPPGAGAVAAGHRRDGRRRGAGERLRRGRAAVAVQRRPLGDRRDHQGPGRPLRGHQHLAVAAVAPASTRSTSTWPTRSPATAAAPGSRSPPRAGPSGSGA